MEVFALLAILSGMNKEEVLEFILSLVDFNQEGCLSFEEVVLVMKITTYALVKISRCQADNLRRQMVLPLEKQLENIATQIFYPIDGVLTMDGATATAAGRGTGAGSGTAGGNDSGGALSLTIERRPIKDIVDRLFHIPEVATWMEHFVPSSSSSTSSSAVGDKIILPSARPTNASATSSSMKRTSSSMDMKQQTVAVQTKKKKKMRQPYTPYEQALVTQHFLLPPITSSTTLAEGGGSSVTEKLTVQQWKSQVALLTPVAFASTNFTPTLPAVHLELEWVNGHEAVGLAYTRASAIVYPAGRYVLVYHQSSHKQEIFSKHSEMVLSLIIHPNGYLIASGQDGRERQAVVYIWDNTSLEVKGKLSGEFERGVSQLAFSPNGELLMAVDGGSIAPRGGAAGWQTLIVYNWQDDIILFKDTLPFSSTGRCIGCSILPKDTLVLACVGEVIFWKTSTEGHYLRRTAYTQLPQREGQQQQQGIGQGEVVGVGYSCLLRGNHPEHLYLGNTDGEILQVVQINIVRKVRGHRGRVTTLVTLPTTTATAGSVSGGGFLSGGEDGHICYWSFQLECQRILDVSRFGPSDSLNIAATTAAVASKSSNTSVLTLAISYDQTTVCLATNHNTVYEISWIDGSDLRGGPIIHGHGSNEDEIYDMDLHPSKHEYVTVARDQRLRIVDMKTQIVLKSTLCSQKISCVAYSPLGDIIAIGTANNTGGMSSSAQDSRLRKQLDTSSTSLCFIYDEENLTCLHHMKDNKSSATVIMFSPEGETLAIGCSDGSILLYSIPDDYDLIAICQRHVSSIISLDFSSQGEWIRSNGENGDLFFFNVDDGNWQSNIAALRDVEWKTQTCPFAWHTKGLHSREDYFPAGAQEFYRTHHNQGLLSRRYTTVMNGNEQQAEEEVERQMDMIVRDIEQIRCCAIPHPPSTEEMKSIANESGVGGDRLSPLGQSIHVLAHGSNLGMIRLSSFPHVLDQAENICYHGHVGRVKRLAFSYDNRYLLSLGQEDRVILQFHCVPHELGYNEKTAGDEVASTTTTGADGSAEGGIAALNTLSEKVASTPATTTPAATATATAGASSKAEVVAEELAFEMIEGPAISQTLKIKPLSSSYTSSAMTIQSHAMTHPRYQWMNHIILPSSYYSLSAGNIDGHGRPIFPSQSLVLDYVYGYETRTLRDNLHYVHSPVLHTTTTADNNNSMGSSREIVYTAGCYGIIQHLDSRGQRYFPYHERRISAFASNVQVRLPTTLNKVIACSFVRKQPQQGSGVSAGGGEDEEVVVVGKDFLYFYTQLYSALPFALPGDLNQMGNLQTFWCVKDLFNSKAAAVVGSGATGEENICCQRCVIGCHDGSLYLFEGHQLNKLVQAHFKGVTALATTPSSFSMSSSCFIVSGGGDGMVRIWSEGLACLMEYNLAAMVKGTNHLVRAVAIALDQKRVVAGVHGGEVVEFDIYQDLHMSARDKKNNAVSNNDKNPSSSSYQVVVHGHAPSLLLGLTVHPRSGDFVTTGDDGMLRWVDSQHHQTIRSVALETGSRCTTFSYDGKLLAVGYGNHRRIKRRPHSKEGGFIIFSTSSTGENSGIGTGGSSGVGGKLKIIYEHKDSNLPLRAMSYTLDSNLLIIGSEDNKIYIYSVKENYHLKHALTQLHQAIVTTVDASRDGRFLMSLDNGQGVRYTNMTTGQKIENGDEEMKDQTWLNYAVPQNWAARSHWLCQRSSSLNSGTNGNSPSPMPPVTTTCRSFSGDYLVSGNEHGEIFLSNFPAHDLLVPSGGGSSSGNDEAVVTAATTTTGAAPVTTRAFPAGMTMVSSHCGPVAKICYLPGDQGVVSIGAEDCLTIQYRCVDNGYRLSSYDNNVRNLTAKRDGASLSAWRQGLNDQSDNAILFANPFVFVKDDKETEKRDLSYPWRSMIAPPNETTTTPSPMGSTAGGNTRPPPPPPPPGALSSLSSVTPHLSWEYVYGCGRSLTTSSCPLVLYNGQGDLIYPVGHLVIIYHKATWQQYLYSGHTREVTALTINHPLDTLCASGDSLPSEEGTDHHHGDGSGSGGSDSSSSTTTTTSFSYPILLGGEEGCLYSYQLIAKKNILPIRTIIDEIQADEDGFIYLLTLDYHDPQQQQPSQPQPSRSGKGSGNSGNSSDVSNGVNSKGGKSWKVIQKISAHRGCILAAAVISFSSSGTIAMGGSSSYLLTSGQDQCIRLWSTTLSLITSWDISTWISSSSLSSSTNTLISSMSFYPPQDSLIVATFTGEVYEISLFGKGSLKIAEGHRSSVGAVHGLATHPYLSNEVVTTGDDGYLYRWHLDYHYALLTIHLKYSSRACQYYYTT
eukprot:scaffold902_cov254-Ochromonas_danica.AAC.17